MECHQAYVNLCVLLLNRRMGMFFKRKKIIAECNVNILFDILSEDMESGLCTDIILLADGEKHHFGTWGTGGEIRKQCFYFFDKLECDNLNELLNKAMLNGILLREYNKKVIVVECNGCYPDSITQLKPYLKVIE